MKKYILLLFVIVILQGVYIFKDAFKETYYPIDTDPHKIRYKSNLDQELYCSICKERVLVYKYTKKGKIICPKCFRKLRDKKFYDK